MHIKIHRVVGSLESLPTAGGYSKCEATIEEIIVPIEVVSLSKGTATSDCMGQYNVIKYAVYISGSHKDAFSVDKEEYERIEKLLAFNNRKELEVLSNSYPEIKVNNAIKDLQVNE